MKTPEEIKKGLGSCSADECHGDHTDCPYIDNVLCIRAICGDALAYIQQLESLVPRWIPVEERLPEHGKNVLVHVANSVGMWHTEIDWQKDNGEWANNADCEWYTVTHWMALPEPPEEE